MQQPLNILTLASGKKLYVDMAVNLARSFYLWNKENEIEFYLATDLPEHLPNDVKGYVKTIPHKPNELGIGFSPKLHLDKIAPAGQTLFIDSDCLIYGDLRPIFAQFKGHDVSVIGYNRYAGLDIGFCKDIAVVMANTGINYFPLLCGSIYYFEQGSQATKVYEHARSLLRSYHEIGLVSLRGKENEEPLMAIAMAKFNQQPINDTGHIKADRMFYEHLSTNVIDGTAKLWNDDKIPVPEYSTLKLALPLIVHFNASYAEIFEYKSEVIRLEQIFVKNKNTVTANLYAMALSVIPGKLAKTAKDILRPLYRAVFGYRKIKTSNRI